MLVEQINIISLIVIFFSYIFSFFFFNKIDKNFFNFIFFYHLLFCLVYFLYSSHYPADSQEYYERSLQKFYDLKAGSYFIINLVRLFSYYLNFSYFNCFLIFNLIGTIGVLFFYLALKEISNIKQNKKNYFFIIIILLPSIYFWSSAIGKDALSFLSICIFIWSSVNLKNRINFIILATILMFLVRPHIAPIMSTSLFISLIFYSKFNLKNKILYMIISTSITLLTASYAFKYIGIPDFISYYPFQINFQSLLDFISRREIANQSLTAGVDISLMNPFMKIFTYLYRPLPFEVKNIYQLFASIENILLIIVCFFGILGLFNKDYYSGENQSRLILVIYTIFTLIILSYTSANLGVNSRQKWMIFPVILTLVFQFSYEKKIIFNLKKFNNK